MPLAHIMPAIWRRRMCSIPVEHFTGRLFLMNMRIFLAFFGAAVYSLQVLVESASGTTDVQKDMNNTSIFALSSAPLNDCATRVTMRLVIPSAATSEQRADIFDTVAYSMLMVDEQLTMTYKIADVQVTQGSFSFHEDGKDPRRVGRGPHGMQTHICYVVSGRPARSREDPCDAGVGPVSPLRPVLRAPSFFVPLVIFLSHDTVIAFHLASCSFLHQPYEPSESRHRSIYTYL